MGKVLAVDFDDVISDTYTHAAPYFNKLAGGNFTRDDMRTPYIEDTWVSLNRDTASRAIEDFVDAEHERITMVEGAKEGLTELKALGHTVVVVTSRPHKLEETTRAWLDRNVRGLYDDIVFTSFFLKTEKTITKAEACKNIGAAVLLEDGMHHAEVVAPSGVPVLLFDAPWNRDGKEDSNITRVSGWPEAVAWVKKNL